VVLKPLTPQNIVIGGASGAMPPVLGWAAMTGRGRARGAAAVPDHLRLDAAALLGAALYRTRTTRKAGLPMLPVTHGPKFTRCRSCCTRSCCSRATLLPFAHGMSGWIYLAAALVLGAGSSPTPGSCGATTATRWRAHLPLLDRGTSSLLFAALLVDHYLAPAIAT
jgi:protoheme IX farnesyltransferase